MGRRVPRTVGWSFVAASLAVSLGGCSAGSAEPAPMPTVKPSPSASTTPAGAPTMPAAARGTDARAAKAFVRHYFDVINYAARSGDTKDLANLTADACKSCKSIEQTIADVYAKGGHVEGENWQLRDATVLQLEPTKAVLSVGAYLAPDVVVTPDGQKTRHAGGKQPMTVFLRLAGRTPVVTRLDLVA